MSVTQETAPSPRRRRSSPPEFSEVEVARFVPVLVTVSKTVRALMGVRLAEIGFHNGQDEALLALEPGEPVAVSALAEVLAVRPSTVSKMMDRLIAKDMVIRIGDTKDTRRTLLKLTEKGILARSEVETLHLSIENELMKSLRTGEATALLGDLTRLQRLLSTRLKRLR